MPSYQYTKSSSLLQHIDSLENFNFPSALIPSENITDILGSNAKTHTTQEASVMTSRLNNRDESVADQALSLSLIFGLILFYVVFTSVYGKIINSIFKCITYPDSVYRIESSFDINLDIAIKEASYVWPIVIAYGSMVLSRSFLPPTYSSIRVFVTMLAMVLLFIVARWIIANTITYIFTSRVVKQRLALGDRINKFISVLVLIPLSLLLSYIDLNDNLFAIILTSIVMGLLIINEIILIYDIFKRENISFLEYILYLCTLEFIPIGFLCVYSLRYFGLI